VTPIAYIEHHRLRFPERRGDVAFFQRTVSILINNKPATDDQSMTK
jgi:hypothetical protein